jgi:hypothetical protein
MSRSGLLDLLLDGLLAAICVVGLLLHLPVVGGEFDRGFDGFQGAFFAGSAVNYQELGTSPTHGYPLAQIDPPADPAGWNVYTNHPRFVPHVALASLRLFGPEGWDERPGPVPPGTEAAVRAPFFLLQVLGWFALAATAWRLVGRRGGLIALALSANLPIGMALAGLVNYEHPSVAFVCAALLLATYSRAPAGDASMETEARRRRFAFAAGVTCGLGTFVTYAPILFVPAIALVCGRGTRLFAAVAGAVTAGLALVPHVLASAAVRDVVGARSPSIFARLEALIAPSWNGELPPARWLAAQFEAIDWSFGVALAAVAAIGLVLALVQIVRTHDAAPFEQLARAVAALAASALGVQVLYWRHTGDPQESFMLNAAPAFVLAIVFALEWLARRVGPRRGPGLAVLVAIGLVAAASNVSRAHLEELRAPGPFDVAETGGASASRSGAGLPPLPRTAALDVEHLVPEGAVVWYPARLGLTIATSYYAWRTLLPFTPGDYDSATALQSALGLTGRPVWILLPLAPDSEEMAADAATVERDIEAFTGAPAIWTEGRLYRATPAP